MRGEAPLAQVGATFLLLSFASFGGATALVPELQRQVVEVRGWMDGAEFAQLFAIAQAAPGPNIILTSLIGWRVAGLAGMAVATLASVVPTSLLAFGFGRLVGQGEARPFGRVLREALARVGVGLILGSACVMGRQVTTSALNDLIFAGAAAAVLFTRRNPVWPLLAGAGLGVLAGALG